MLVTTPPDRCLFHLAFPFSFKTGGRSHTEPPLAGGCKQGAKYAVSCCFLLDVDYPATLLQWISKNEATEAKVTIVTT